MNHATNDPTPESLRVGIVGMPRSLSTEVAVAALINRRFQLHVVADRPGFQAFVKKVAPGAHVVTSAQDLLDTPLDVVVIVGPLAPRDSGRLSPIQLCAEQFLDAGYRVVVKDDDATQPETSGFRSQLNGYVPRDLDGSALAAEVLRASRTVRGKVVRTDMRGFGFVKTHSGEQFIFARGEMQSRRDFRAMRGKSVIFEVVPTDKGPRAMRVTATEGSASPALGQ